MQKQNFTPSRTAKGVIRAIGVTILALTITACDPSIYTNEPAPQTRTSPSSPSELARRGDHEGAARAYRRLAADSTGVQRDKYYLEAADQWFRSNQYRESQRDLYRITGILDSNAQVRKILLLTRIELEMDNPARALETIEKLNPDGAPEIARPYYALRALALFDLGRLYDGTESFLSREQYLRSPRELEDNRQRLWSGLIDATTQGYRDDSQTENHKLYPWVSLAEDIANAYNRRTQQQALEAWRKKFPDHPAYRIAANKLPKINEEQRYAGSSVDFSGVNRVAVLIPLSGRLNRAGELIQRGIQAANDSSGNPYQLSFFDTGADVYSAYSQAMQFRPDAIIGPLDKNNIQALSSRFGSVPVLSLNRISEADSVQPSSYPNLAQFGLAPEDEARIAATSALAEGHTQMVAFVPANEWGSRVINSFSDVFTAGGGTLVEIGNYSTRDNDHSESIKALLNLDESHNRYAQISALFGEVEFEPRRRQDVDAIFIAAQPKQGRLIRPQLKFHYANRLPVYATSSIYAADRTRNKDIDGVRLPLSHWEADPYTTNPELASLVDVYSPDDLPNTQLLRLFALGHDALMYIQHASANIHETPVEGLTGALTLDEYGLIRRNLPIVTIKNGQPRQ